jgi:hypothetical protein
VNFKDYFQVAFVPNYKLLTLGKEKEKNPQMNIVFRTFSDEELLKCLLNSGMRQDIKNIRKNYPLLCFCP